MDGIALTKDFSSALNPNTRLLLYRKMLECRMLEKRTYDLFMQNLVKGATHLALGQEEASLEVIEAETEAMTDEATETPRNSKLPPEDIAYDDVWADGSATWRN